MEILILTVTVLNLLFTGAFAFLFLRFVKGVPNLMQNVLDDVGGSITEQLQELFSTPTIKKAYSIIGKKGAQVKADDALRNKVAEKALGASPVISKTLEYFDVTPIEGLQLLNDPLFGPIIQGFIAKAQDIKIGQNPAIGSSTFGDQNLVKR